ncbi:ABC transporter substrate-binding protein [Lentibacillus cibarius]|uniref:Spermidine/putrescine ABC transporter substrate-binding protein n=1 Tax=Lentibacillus cibarius TaxID=2583219 RepID=A0A5S3QN72_9BACI|nr:spermidine/putrescine ABC transporter substrate-binding protein [Lentibacillus cibarius]TMN23265.1 spermidine/putrescine ABC transporter substrate-binding protein [Lentibacillus cibarius]
MKGKLIILLTVLVATLVACSENGTDSSDAKGNGKLSDELIVFNWSEYMPQEILDEFEEEFGVDIVYSTFSSNQEMLAKINAGTVSYDVVVPSDFYVNRLKEQELIQEINFDNIPNYKNISDEWKELPFDPDEKYSIPYMYGYDGIAYNKEKVDEPPTSWADLWNPAYKGHVITMEEPKENFNMLLQYLGYDHTNPTEEQLKEGGEKLKELVPNLLSFKSTPEAEFVSGEAWIGYAYSGAAAVAWKENKNVGFVLPKEGGIRWTDNMVIPKNAEHKYTAEVFINYLLRPEVSKKLSEAYPYGNPNEAAVEMLDDSIKNSPGLIMPEEKIEKTDWGKPLRPEKKKLMNRYFQKAKVE